MSARKVIRCLGFTGQGSQWVGMGDKLLKQFPQTKHILEEVDSTMGYSLSHIMFSGPEGLLRNTKNTQVGIFAYCAMILESIKDLNLHCLPELLTGHSVGEFCAYYASSVLSLHDCVLLLKRRAELTIEACEGINGGMAAVLFCPLSVVQAAADQLANAFPGICEVTNVNSPSQVVVSGEMSQLKRLQGVLRDFKEGKRARVRLLNVSYPFHSSCLKEAAVELEKYAQTLIKKDPQIPVLSNFDGFLMTKKEDILSRVGKQLASPVQWEKCMNHAAKLGMTDFIEIGPKPVLSQFMKEINKSVRVTTICNEGEISLLFDVCFNHFLLDEQIKWCIHYHLIFNRFFHSARK